MSWEVWVVGGGLIIAGFITLAWGIREIRSGR